MQQKDYYKTLGISETASPAEVKKAYHSLAKKHHPDKNAGNSASEAKFKEVSEAYEVLGNAGKRKKYDELRKYATSGTSEGSMSYEDFMSRFGGKQQTSEDDTNWGFGNTPLNDIFSNLFGGMGGGEIRFASGGGGRRQSTRQRKPRGFDAVNMHANGEPQSTDDPFFKRLGNDAYIDMNINLAQSMLGSKVRVRTPDGKKVVVNIPAGTQPEAFLRVTGMGYYGGDLYIRIHLAIPKALTDEQKEKVKELAAAMKMKW